MYTVYSATQKTPRAVKDFSVLWGLLPCIAKNHSTRVSSVELNPFSELLRATFCKKWKALFCKNLAWMCIFQKHNPFITPPGKFASFFVSFLSWQCHKQEWIHYSERNTWVPYISVISYVLSDIFNLGRNTRAGLIQPKTVLVCAIKRQYSFYITFVQYSSQLCEGRGVSTPFSGQKQSGGQLRWDYIQRHYNTMGCFWKQTVLLVCSTWCKWPSSDFVFYPPMA